MEVVMAAVGGTVAVDVRDLVAVRGGRVVLDGVRLRVAAGTVTGLLGPSGAGKTTLLRAEIGYLTQAPAVYGDLTVAEHLRYFAAVTRAGRGRVGELADSLRIGELMGRVVDRLSGGQRARVSLAVAMVGDPRVLLLDEPTAGLDPLLRRDLWRLFHQLAAEGRTLLVSTHVMDEARRCGELVLLHEGRLLAAGPPQVIAGSAGADAVEDAFVRLVEGRQQVGAGR
jgi:ABC-2 type transport system ATP-binding protein